MLGLIQRVSSASVTIDDAEIAKIGQGIALLLGIQKNDNEDDAEKLLIKTLNYRIFADLDGKMNRSLRDIAGELLIVSQSTQAGYGFSFLLYNQIFPFVRLSLFERKFLLIFLPVFSMRNIRNSPQISGCHHSPLHR